MVEDSKPVKKTLDLGPFGDDEVSTFLEARIRVGIQGEIYKAMKSSGIDEAELAKRLGVSRQRVDKFFSRKSNFNIVSLAKILKVLGHECSITFNKVVE